MKKIVLTGGGTAGHVTPNIALLPELYKHGYAVEYIGSIAGIEKELIGSLGVPYHSISSGKLRRYIDPKNLSDVFRVVKGLLDAVRLLHKIKPDIVFSKGGFVTVPVVAAAHFLKIPVIIHESDISPGLANRMAIPFCSFICASFPETLANLPDGKAQLTGSPVRETLFDGVKAEGLALCAFEKEKPVVLVMGGSLGSVKINNCLREALPQILPRFNVIHICGKGNVNEEMKPTGYVQFEYIGKELPHIFAAADIIVSRAGANSIYEFLALKKPNLLIPLSKEASRGDQIMNAESFKAQGFSMVLAEEEMNSDILVKSINELYKNRETYRQKMSESKLSSGVKEIMKLILEKTKS